VSDKKNRVLIRVTYNSNISQFIFVFVSINKSRVRV